MIFENRIGAGRKLAKKLLKYKASKPLILAIPRGGVITALPVCKELEAEFDLMIVRKLPIPWNPEAGFGAVAMDGTVYFNPEVYPLLNLPEAVVEEVVRAAKLEVERRNQVYRQGKPYPAVEGRVVILVDDGIATGYTVLAAVRSLHARRPSKLVVTAPIAQAHAAELVEREVDELICLHLSYDPIFAVASFYKDFPELSDAQVLKALQKARTYSQFA